VALLVSVLSRLRIGSPPLQALRKGREPGTGGGGGASSHPSGPSVNGGAGGGPLAVAWTATRTIRHDRKEDPMTDKTTPDAPDTETVDPDTVDPETATDPEGDPVENPSG
jgi:hypothetical protein